MEINGTTKFVGETVDVGTAGFQKRELVVTTDEQYPQHILINFVQDKCNLLADIKTGDKVTVGINLRGREWVNPEGESKYFNDIQGWKITKTAATAATVTPTAPQPAAPVQKYVHTATDATYEAYKQAQWTDKQLVDNGKGRFEVATATPPPAPVKTEEHDDLPF